MIKKFTAILNSSDNKLWGAHFEVPVKIAESLCSKESRRVVCRLNNAVEFQCGILRGVRSKYVITVNKKIRTQLKIKTSDKLSIELHPDESEYGLPISEELAEALKLDDEGSQHFHALTPGKQRTLIYIASNVKNTDLRIARALAIIDHLKENNGIINYKKLNSSIKNQSQP